MTAPVGTRTSEEAAEESLANGRVQARLGRMGIIRTPSDAPRS
jgi:hypothetical protein